MGGWRGAVDYSWASRGNLIEEDLQFNIGKGKEEEKVQESEVWWQEGA